MFSSTVIGRLESFQLTRRYSDTSLRKHAHAIKLRKHAHAIFRELFQFHWQNLVNFNMFAQNIYGGYTLTPSRRGGSNEYLQSVFWNWNKNKKKNRYTPANPSFFYINVGVKGV